MTEPSGGKRPVNGQRRDKGTSSGKRPVNGQQRDRGTSTDTWEQRASDMAGEIQRWLIRASARNVRDELGGQVKKALRGSERNKGDSWATATTEPPHAADEAPECAWCPVCRAARRIAQSRSGGGSSGSGPRVSDAADVMAGAVRDALAGIDSILSYRPSGSASSGPAASGPSGSSKAEQSSSKADQPSAQAAEAEHPDDPTERA
ncbi:MAG: hypothetical protein LBV34_10635 [Nocardiopsaceae bacterium]|jgi:hypothetical protein|nr:hypothetical protein [Nocardiopsaceae bacterium]